MHICHGVDYLPEYHKVWGGAEVAALSQIELLEAAGHRQSVIATQPIKDVKEKFDFYAISVLDDYFGRWASILKLWTFDLLAYRHALKVLKSLKPDVLHLHNFRTLSFSVVAAAKRLGIPIVFSIYDNWSLCPNHTLVDKSGRFCNRFHGLHCWKCTYAHKKISSFFRKAFFDHFLRQIDAFMVLSETMKNVLQSYGIEKNKIFTIPLPLTKAAKKAVVEAGVQTESHALLFAGWISPHKGFKVLAQAFDEVIGVIADARLYCIETGVDRSYKKEIIDFINKRALQQHIFFLGKLSNQAVQEMLQKAELVVVPEQWGIAWPIFLTEAMAAGKPIVASRIGDIPQFIRDGVNGFTVPADDSHAFAKKIIECLRQKELMKGFGCSGRQIVMEMCKDENITERLMSTYLCVTKRAHGEKT